MLSFFKIAWRNLWRNKRRTLITAASIFFGLIFAIFMSSMQKGSLGNMVSNMVKFNSGYIQVQEQDYKESRSINNGFVPGRQLMDQVGNNNGITHYTRRVESFALASGGPKSFSSMVVGIEPEKENAISGLSKWISDGSFLKAGSDGVLLGKTLAENLDLVAGDTLVLIGQGYHGVSAAGKYEVKGLLDVPLPEMSKQIVYMNLATCQELYSLPGQITSLVLMVENQYMVDPVAKELKDSIDTGLKAYTWQELQPELQNLIDGKVASGKIIIGVLFMIIGFGIWGTVIMLMAERRREFGVMIALGMKKGIVLIVLLMETALIALLGIVAGIAATFPVVRHLSMNPIPYTGKAAESAATAS